MDKFVRKIKTKAPIKGAGLKDIRRHFRPTDDSYDSVREHQTHKQRLLLKAEPQVGKTGKPHTDCVVKLAKHRSCAVDLGRLCGPEGMLQGQSTICMC